MYERHFALSGPPFQLNPDPAFYYDSRGHNNALAYLNFGVHQGEGFIVVTGEVGAGKTTLVRKLLAGLNAQDVVAAQIASTQLGADDLLRSVLRAFGEATQGRSKADVLAALEAYLTSLSAVGRRALLVVDEAQNLQPEAIEELRMLSNFQWGPRPVLQSFLVGQPELRAKLQLPWMEQLRQRVIASCHLGPLEPGETRAYVEHRLRRVGWVARPTFDDGAFDQVHRWSQGLPRRINLLCNRLMLAACLGEREQVGADDVARVAADFRGELGQSAPLPDDEGAAQGRVAGRPAWRADEAQRGAGPLSGQAALASKGTSGRPCESASRCASERPSDGEGDGEGAGAGARGPNGRPLVELHRHAAPGPPLRAPTLCMVDTPATRLRCAVLARAWEAQRDMPPLLVLHAGPANDWPTDEALDAVLPGPALVAHLGVRPGPFAAQMAELQLRFAGLLRPWAPSSLLLLGQGDATLACALVAAKLGLPVFRVAPASGHAPREPGRQLNAALLDTLSDLVLQEGAAAQVGSLMASAIARLRPVLPPAPEVWHRLSPAPWPGRPLLMVSGEWAPARRCTDRGAVHSAELVDTLCELSGTLAVVWLASDATRLRLAEGALAQRLSQAGVCVAAPPPTLDCLGLLKRAACLLHDGQGGWAEEAEALGTAVVGASDVMKQAVLAAAACAATSSAPAAVTVAAVAAGEAASAGADIVALLRRWRLRERLMSAREGAADRPAPPAWGRDQGPRSTVGENAYGHSRCGSAEPSAASDQVLDAAPAWAGSSGSA